MPHVVLTGQVVGLYPSSAGVGLGSETVDAVPVVSTGLALGHMDL